MRVVDLKEVKELPHRAVHVEGSWIAHIVTAQGKGGQRSFGQAQTYSITKCNRALVWPNTLDSLTGYDVCARCGTVDEVQAVVDVFVARRKASHEKWQVEQKAREEKAEAARAAYEEAQEELIDHLSELGVELEAVQRWRIVLTYNERSWELRPIWPEE